MCYNLVTVRKTRQNKSYKYKYGGNNMDPKKIDAITITTLLKALPNKEQAFIKGVIVGVLSAKGSDKK